MKNRNVNVQKKEPWLAILNGLIAAINTLLSILTFVIIVSKRDVVKSENSDDGWRDGHSGYGFYVGDIKSDDE
ncbi:hypothetical protein J8Z86_04220 [Yersinia enterocolitica]|uniref:DUF3742 family protein n=1 Tax=Yersinia enterocolitica TaxID=630 RepID=UPI001C8D0DFF|nr:DUF3742 family protein [Yersinia enterocolitica]MBX9495287.1 hypothetical protein [Yersinia enterocolitica]HDL6629865.1 hypothetical protein [Yersinia enterocolitica]HDL6655582.1 hypothetical protein [Yersinia enterocolitica]HDL6682310.1 hypothetical protein [Yersinia enterocolitica]